MKKFQVLILISISFLHCQKDENKNRNPPSSKHRRENQKEEDNNNLVNRKYETGNNEISSISEEKGFGQKTENISDSNDKDTSISKNKTNHQHNGDLERDEGKEEDTNDLKPEIKKHKPTNPLIPDINSVNDNANLNTQSIKTDSSTYQTYKLDRKIGRSDILDNTAISDNNKKSIESKVQKVTGPNIERPNNNQQRKKAAQSKEEEKDKKPKIDLKTINRNMNSNNILIFGTCNSGKTTLTNYLLGHKVIKKKINQIKKILINNKSIEVKKNQIVIEPVFDENKDFSTINNIDNDKGKAFVCNDTKRQYWDFPGFEVDTINIKKGHGEFKYRGVIKKQLKDNIKGIIIVIERETLMSKQYSSLCNILNIITSIFNSEIISEALKSVIFVFTKLEEEEDIANIISELSEIYPLCENENTKNY